MTVMISLSGLDLSFMYGKQAKPKKPRKKKSGKRGKC